MDLSRASLAYPCSGKRRLLRLLAELKPSIERAELDRDRLAMLWARHAPDAGLKLATNASGHLHWRTASPVFDAEQAVVFGSEHVGALRQHLNDSALSVLVGFEYRRVVLNARLVSHADERSLLRDWADHLSEIETLIPVSARPSSSNEQVLDGEVRARHGFMGDPRASPLRGRRAFFREQTARYSELATANALAVKLIDGWKVFGADLGIALNDEGDRPILWRALKSTFGHRRRLEFFGNEITSIRANLDAYQLVVFLGFEYRRSTLTIKRRILSAELDTLATAYDELRALEDLSPRSLRSLMTAPEHHGHQPRQPQRRPLSARE